MNGKIFHGHLLKFLNKLIEKLGTRDPHSYWRTRMEHIKV